MLRPTIFPARLAVVVLIPLFLAACASGESFEVAKPDRLPDLSAKVENVLLVTLGSGRVDRLGIYGDTGAATPNIDSLAKNGTRFDQCQTPAPCSASAMASFLTGTYGFEHGARQNKTHWLLPSIPTLAEKLRAAGISPLAAVSHESLGFDSGLSRGFTAYDCDLSKGLSVPQHELMETHATNTVDRALALLDKQSDGRWFLWVHLDDPAAPYVAPAAFRGSTSDKYGDELAYTDSQIGRLLDALEARGQRANTLVAVTAVAGEGLGQNAENGHGLLLHNITTRVPLIVSHASVAGGSVVPGAVSLIDLAPTLAELMGQTFSTQDSRSLVASLRDPAVHDRERYVYTEALEPLHEYGLAPLYAVTSASVRYIEGARPELYELATDPDELTNTYRPARAEDTDAPSVLAAFRARKSVDRRAQILRLDQVTERMSPKTIIGRIGAAKLALSRMRAPFEQADQDLLITLIKQMPGWVTPRTMLVSELRRSGETDKALALAKGAFKHGAVRASSLIRLANHERTAGAEQWEEHLKLAEALEPMSVTPPLYRIRIALEAGDSARARLLLEQAIEKRPHDVLLVSELSAMLLKSGDIEESIRLAKSVQLAAQSWGRGYELEAKALFESGKQDEALSVYDKRLAVEPNNVLLVALAARTEWDLQRFDASIARLEAAITAQPDNLAMLKETANQAMAVSRWSVAAKHLARLCELNPTQSEHWESRLHCQLALGDIEGAGLTADQVLSLNPTFFPALVFQAVKSEQDGDLEVATELYLRAQANNPEALAREAAKNPFLIRIKERLEG